MVVLDSDILVAFLRGDSEGRKAFDLLENRGEKLNTTVINAFELFEGSLLRTDYEKKFRQAEMLLNSLGYYNFDDPAVRVAANISAGLIKRGEPLDFQDLCIASIAIINNETLVTRNTKHFGRIKGLKIEKW